MELRKICSIIMLCAIAVSAMAIPARRGGVVRTAADGTQKMVFLHGDETFHYMTDADGNWLEETSLLPMSAETQKVRQANGAARLKVRKIQQETKVGTTPNIAPRGLVILVSFKDKAFATPKETIDEMMNGDNFARNYTYKYSYNGRIFTEHIQSSGSARKYFQDQSYGQYNPQFDVVGPYTVSQNYSYYGANDYNGDDKYPDKMIQEACKLANADGADFTLYDNDNDGKVDFVYVIYAGYGEADGGAANTIWPHNYALSYTNAIITLDDKKIDNYACSNEIQYASDMYNGIGTFCHEFSHVMGLPDLYCTSQSYSSPHTLMEWDILDYGPYNNDGNTPPAYSAYERFFCGWITPRVMTDPENVSLVNLNTSKEALLLCSGDKHNLVGYNPNPTTFYLLENRQKEGWDAYLPGKGMLITKIQYSSSKWENNTVNNSSRAMGVDILEATSNTTSTAKATDAFPAGATEWTDFSGHEVTDITLGSDGVIRFLYRGGSGQGVEDVADPAAKVEKVMKNGQVMIIKNGKKYTVTGQEIR